MANTPESISHIQIGQDTHPIDAVSVGGKTLENLQSDFQLKSNMVTSLSSSSTDSQYPSAKLVYDILGDIERRLSNI